jgi:hypothetical protein
MLKRSFSLFIFFIMSLSCLAQETAVPMEPQYWDTAGTNSKFISYNNRKAIHLTSSMLRLKNQTFENGIIEVDVAVLNERSFSGLVFREANGHHEELYLRLHKSGQPDAVQYTPSFNKESVWHHYPEYQAAYSYAGKEWVHVKIEINGVTCKIFLDTVSKPLIVIPVLRTGNNKGNIGLWANNNAIFSNFKYTKLPDGGSDNKAAAINSPQIIRNYQLSEAEEIRKDKIQQPVFIPITSWQNVTAEPDGLLNIGKFIKKKRAGSFEENSNDLVWIKFSVLSDKETTRQLFFEFTNRCWVYINGKLLYAGDNTFRLRGLLFRGELGKNINSQSLYLPLTKGENEIRVAVTAVANGWGWMARWAE